MTTQKLAALAIVSLIGLALCQRALSQTVSYDSPAVGIVTPSPLMTAKYYLTDIPNLATSGTIAANPNLDANLQSAAAEASLLSTPPKLKAFVWTPSGTAPASGWPAVVMMGGHGGIYSTDKPDKNPGTFEKLSNRSKMWGDYWKSKGFVAILMDDFTAYGMPMGFPDTDASNRPGWASAANARPYFAYSALAAIKAKFDHVNETQVVLMGWSNGGTTTLSALAATNTPLPVSFAANTSSGFQAGFVLYPACGMENRYAISGNGVGNYDSYVPIHLINAAADTKVDITVCNPKLLDVVAAKSDRLTMETRAGATHNFDANNATTNGNSNNVAARDHALTYAVTFIKDKLGL
ncbi:dienelactone hydrolase family protein [Asticcacaulis sp. AC402]|uniref:dienelactone hydrolase family protein n=1 Tax=Asticcacaulis sp. AC402 TaxID=1282361 RepID=UPI0003C40DFF|nr:hypothetical protein [Asticcacaulis sp. AC402]ESQ74998.1 hypothetical protein ABAC402_11380 [Asticcacaulis sp. AC402]